MLNADIVMHDKPSTHIFSANLHKMIANVIEKMDLSNNQLDKEQLQREMTSILLSMIDIPMIAKQQQDKVTNTLDIMLHPNSVTDQLQNDFLPILPTMTMLLSKCNCVFVFLVFTIIFIH